MPAQLDESMSTDHEHPTPMEDVKKEAAEDSISFESNEDYQITLKARNILRHQLRQATADVNTLIQLKNDAMAHPFEFIRELKSNKTRRRVPRLQRIVSVPDVDWSKYRLVPESRLAQQAATLSTMAQHYSGIQQSTPFRNALDFQGETASGASSFPTSPAAKCLQQELSKAMHLVGTVPSRAGSVSDMSDHSDDDSLVPRMGKGKGKRRTSMAQTGMDSNGSTTPLTPRIRSMTEESLPESDGAENRGVTHNQSWTDEEQRRLEEFLEIYPDEPIQAQRFNKISKALGTRTPRQVASRVQKYFIKLAKLGLPVPGRITIPPSVAKPLRGGNARGRGSSGRGSRARGRGLSVRGRPAALRTSGVGYNATISGGLTNQRISGAMYMNAQGPPSVLMSDDEHEDEDIRKTMLKVETSKTPQETATPSDAIHLGYACDACKIEPIVGVRYKCTACDESEEVDLCGKCMAAGTFSNDQHTPDHPFEAIQVACAPYYADNDYTSPDYLGEYSYLGF